MQNSGSIVATIAVCYYQLVIAGLCNAGIPIINLGGGRKCRVVQIPLISYTRNRIAIKDQIGSGAQLCFTTGVTYKSHGRNIFNYNIRIRESATTGGKVLYPCKISSALGYVNIVGSITGVPVAFITRRNAKIYRTALAKGKWPAGGNGLAAEL